MCKQLKTSSWIILYGGTDIEWIRKFYKYIHGISVDSGTSVEMIYVGKNEKIGEIKSSVLPTTTLKSYSLDAKKIWYFWIRLESLLISRYHILAASDYGTDPINREVKRLLNYASVESWACLITPYSEIIIHDIGDVMLKGLMEYDSWKQHIHSSGFAKIFKDHISQLRLSQVSNHPCSRIVLNIDNKNVIQNLVCPYPNCNFDMDKKIQYICCHKDDHQLE